MRPALKTLHEALAYQLEGLYDAEKKLQKAIPNCLGKITASSLKSEMEKYLGSAADKRTKLKRIFSYLLVDRFGKKNKVIETMLEETHDILEYTSTNSIRDAVMIGCVQTINHYKIAGYGTALAFAMELKLNTVSDLLHEILEWEKETDRTLTKIALKEVNEKAGESELTR